MTRRVVAWFSHGACSAIACKLTLAKYGPDVILANIDTGAEHSDNERFRIDCEKWYQHPITVLKSEQFTDTWDVWEKTRYLVGPSGARCTGELKKKVRYRFELPDDLNIFGYAADKNDAARAARFVEQAPGVDVEFPLIDQNLKKRDCLTLLGRAGLVIPAMYRLGYTNNNCIGCVKGGMGYWNKIRQDFPETFERMAKLERELKHTVLRSKGEPLYLDELAPDRGNYKAEEMVSCDFACQATEAIFTKDEEEDACSV